MKQQKNTTKKSTSTPKNVCVQEKRELAQATEYITRVTTADDVRNAVLIVSLVVNLFFLTAWILLQVTTKYDYAVAAALFGR